MNSRERELATLNLQPQLDRGSVEETFLPWDKTLKKWKGEGLPEKYYRTIFKQKILLQKENSLQSNHDNNDIVYLQSKRAVGVMEYEQFLGFDRVMRIEFMPSFRLEDLSIEFFKSFSNWKEDWKKIRGLISEKIKNIYNDRTLKNAYLPYRNGCMQGDYSVRLNITGFFWNARDLLGIERHLLAFYDCPKLLHEINSLLLQIYYDKLDLLLKIIPVDLVYIQEDLSGVNGPMLSPEHFDEFIASYYKRLFPFLRSRSVRNIFIDTDGNFTILIPNFLAAGIDGFLPVDVNTGVDILEIRKQYPQIKFIGGFNKLALEEGRKSIDREFERILPVIKQGGYIPGVDHQVTPDTKLENYRYYISRLSDIMQQAGVDLRHQ